MSSLRGKARGFRGQEDTVERNASLNAALKKINQLKQAMPEPRAWE